MRSWQFFALVLALAAASGPLHAEAPAGCDQFKWPIERAQAAQAAPDRKVFALLTPVETVHFALAPEARPRRKPLPPC
jgi:hypothetical protein